MSTSLESAKVPCGNASCENHVSASAAEACPFCHKVVFCNDACMAEGWTDHVDDCNIMQSHTETCMPAVPAAWQGTATPAQWKTQTEPFPAYMTQFRNANGTVIQSIIPAVDAPVTPSKQQEHIEEHFFSLTAEYIGTSDAIQTVTYEKLIAPDHMVHTNSSLQKAVAQAKTRATTGSGFTYWVGSDITSKKETLVVPDLGEFDGPGRVKITLNIENRKTPIVIEAPLVPMNDFDDQVRSKLGHHLRQHLQMQYKHKGLGSGEGLVTYMAFNKETGARAMLTFDRTQGVGQAHLVDMEAFVPTKGNSPIVLQTETFEHTVDARSASDIGALIECLEERVHHLKSRIESESKLNDDPQNETLLDLQDHVSEYQNHLAILESHQDALKTGNTDIISSSVNATINHTLNILWEPIGGRSQVYFNSIFEDQSWKETAEGELESMARRLIKRMDDKRKLNLEAGGRRGGMRRGFARTRLRVVDRDIKAVKKEIRKLISAATLKSQNVYNTLSNAGMDMDSIYAAPDYVNLNYLVEYGSDVLAGRYSGTLAEFKASIADRRLRFQGKKGGFQERGREWGRKAKENVSKFSDHFRRGGTSGYDEYSHYNNYNDYY